MYSTWLVILMNSYYREVIGSGHGGQFGQVLKFIMRRTLLFGLCRAELCAAITQARRVAGGRRALGNNLDLVRIVGIERILSKGKLDGKLKKIFLRNEMSVWQKCKIFCVAEHYLARHNRGAAKATPACYGL